MGNTPLTDQISNSFSEYPFKEFLPVFWTPLKQTAGEESDLISSVKRNHGIKGTYCLHNPKDQINFGKKLLDRVIVEYRIRNNSYNLYTVGDFFQSTYAIDWKADGNIMGDIAERIARRITKYWLKHFSKEGYTGGIFDKRFNPSERNNFIVAHSDRYVLKIQKYPNLVILDKTGRGKYGYENIKELDGLFDYRISNQRHILVLESKLDRINVDYRDLTENLFKPLNQVFPEAVFTYILFSGQDSIYVKKSYDRVREIKQLPQNIYQTLGAHRIGTLFFTFNESMSDFERIKNHIITQYRSIAHLGIELKGRMRLSTKEIVLFDEGETPHMKLIKDKSTGLWREVNLTHKTRKN
jgi:hypothetical protein